MVTTTERRIRYCHSSCIYTVVSSVHVSCFSCFDLERSTYSDSANDRFLQVVFVMAVQLVMAYTVRNLPWWKVLVLAYTVSGTCNQNLLSAQHEISHFLALKKPFWNKVLAVASNCPIVVPVATKFRQYHQEHHSHLVCCRDTMLCS